MQNRNFTVVALASLFIVGGCSGAGDTTTGPGTFLGTPLAQPAPHPAQPQPTPSTAPIANWTGDATVVSVAAGSTPACGWGVTPGETRSGVEWRIDVTGDSVSLDEDLPNWPTDDNPFSGHLDGAQFTASDPGLSNYADYVCQFSGGTLTGHFTSDSTFVAVETLVWGVPGKETTVVRHWNGSRL